MKKDLIKLAVCLIACYVLFRLYSCSKPKPVIKKGKNDTIYVHTETRDTLIVHDTIRLKTKPKVVFRWADSTKISHDTGANYSIVDTIRNNEVVGRAVFLTIPTTTIEHKTIDSIFIYRTDTITITTNKGFKLGFGLGIATGFVLGKIK